MRDTPRWYDYFLDSDFVSFWNSRLGETTVRPLVIFGIGFDPRALRVIEALSQLRSKVTIGCLALEFQGRPAAGPAGQVTEEMVAANRTRLQALGNVKNEGTCVIAFQDADGHSIAGHEVVRAIHANLQTVRAYSDVIVDISAMPTDVFFPLLNYLVRECDRLNVSNLHVAITEDPELDAAITGQEYGRADFFHTFRPRGPGSFVWLPLLGLNRREQLEKIHQQLGSGCVEICPVLPFPASKPRIGDDIVVAYRDLLFEAFEVAYENILYCDEGNPFDIYRKVVEVAQYYKTLDALKELPPVTTVLSPLSSKTLSLGMLLAAIERQLPVCSVVPGSYVLPTTLPLESRGAERILEVWLAGEPYLI